MHRGLVALHSLLARLLLPPGFRTEFAEELEIVVRKRVRSARESARSIVALLEILDLLRTAAREWARAATEATSRFADGVRLDLRVAARSLARSPQTTTIAVATIAIAIGAGTAVYSVLDGVVLRPLPYPDADRIVRVAVGAHPESGTTEGPFSPRGYWHIARNTRAFESVGTAGVVQRALVGIGVPASIDVALVTRSAFEVIGIEPVLGRLPSPAEDRPDGPAVTLISHALWQDRFGTDPSVLGGTVTLGPTSYEIIGVMPPGYDFPTPDANAWIPRKLDPATENYAAHFLTLVARLRPGVTIDDARSDTERLIAGFPELGYRPEWFEGIFTGAAVVRPLKDEIVGAARQPILTVLGMVAILLLVAFTNVANLLLVRAERRRGERALRGALGARRAQIARYTLIESGLLSSVGALVGVGSAWIGTRSLVAFGPMAIPRQEEIAISPTVLLFTTSLSLGGALLFGLVPIAFGSDPRTNALSGVGRGTSSARSRSTTRDILTVGQVTLAVILLAAAGMMIRTAVEQRAIDPGFRAERVLTYRLSPSAAKYPNPEASARFYDELLERVRALPGVAAAGGITELPLTGGGRIRDATIEGVPTPDGEFGTTFYVKRATPGYFEAMGIPVVEGRPFMAADHDDRLGSLVISESVKRAFWPEESALGKRIETWGAPATVVGVVGNVHEVDIDDPPPHMIYKPLLDSIGGGGLSLALAVRAEGDGDGLTQSLRQVVAGIDADLPVADVRPMDAIVREALSRTTFTMLLTALAAGVALFLAGIGIYGVLSYTMSQRRTEVAIRMAVGAERADVVRLVLSHGLRLAILGLLVGLVGAVVVERVLRSALADVRALDVETLGGVVIVLVIASAAASIVPALTSGRTAPDAVLREDV